MGPRKNHSDSCFFCALPCIIIITTTIIIIGLINTYYYNYNNGVFASYPQQLLHGNGRLLLLQAAAAYVMKTGATIPTSTPTTRTNETTGSNFFQNPRFVPTQGGPVSASAAGANETTSMMKNMASHPLFSQHQMSNQSGNTTNSSILNLKNYSTDILKKR